MQKLCAVRGGVNAYLDDPDMLVTAETRVCPFCPDGHRLRRHGYYQRWALLPDPDLSVRIPVRRLLCAVVGQTVSLLPDFCLPRRQHGPEILGVFLHARIVLGLALGAALRRARPDAAGHSVAQALISGFLHRAELIRAYLASLRSRALRLPSGIPRPHRELASLVLGLLHRARDPGRTFRVHGRAFFARFLTGLA
jgi:hypothetical protein